MNLSRIILGLVLIVGSAGALAVGGTSAFFSDTETSTGNVFTAGGIDLKIDHTLQTYNDSVLGGSLSIVSDTQTTFAGDDGSGNAVALLFVHPAWTASIPGATWIWATNGPTNPSISQTNTFTRTFVWNGPVVSASLLIAADNHYTAKVNGNVLPVVFDENNFQVGTQDTYNIQSFIVSGVNTIEIVVTNLGVPGSDGQGNPAGLLYKAIVQGNQTTWSEKDLSDGDVFWNFNDVKPGDRGTNVISMHVYDNDAYACMMTENVTDNENTNIEPEQTAGDVTSPQGELAQFLKLFIWDDDGDGIYEPGTESSLYQGGFTGVGMQRFSLKATTTDYLGSAWCFGVQTVNPNGTVSCDGSDPQYNVAQTDSLTSDLVFTAVQQRNNANFTCGNGGGCNLTGESVLIDGGFENPEVTNPAQWDVFASPAGGWNVAWRDDIPATFGVQNRPAIAKLEFHEGVVGPADEGDQYVELDTDWAGPNGTGDGEPASVKIYQDIATTPGATYTWKYSFSPRPNTPAADNRIEMRWGGNITDDTGSVAGLGTNSWSVRTGSVVATTSTTRIQFTDLGTANSIGSFVDNFSLVKISCVPIDAR